MKRYARTALALALALSSGTAAALGLGQIEVRSRLGQPFLAEIPIISSDPAELENLQAELASPITFARIGLQPPTGIVADLQFTSALDGAGNPVIRVTSQQPVNDPLLTFLVSVDWGQGRLVHEYSALLDTPRTVSAPLQPQVDEAMVSAPNTIERAPVAAPAPEPAPEEADPASVDQAEGNAIAATPEPEPRPERQPDPVAVATPPPMPSQAPVAATPEGELRVHSGDTLSEIASQLDTPAFTLDQTMIALLRANPDAFIGGNINRLRQGAVLRVPTGNELSEVEAAQASRLVSSQTQQWQASRRAIPQPASANASTTGAVGAPVEPASAATAATASRTAEARLEIVPPGASRATQAGTQSGINAGGEGEMLRQELQQTQETLAARDAELQELKGRVAELEQLQNKQQQLITMKDSELAAAQQRLAQTQQAGDGGGAAWPWLAGGGAILLALGAGWLLRRRPAKPVFRAPTGATPSIADAFAAAPAVAAEPEETVEAKGTQIAAAAELQAQAQAPAWHVHASGQGHGARQESLLGAQPGEERLELARAYLDLGDHDSARQLLSDIVINGDLIARQQAARMLQELD